MSHYVFDDLPDLTDDVPYQPIRNARNVQPQWLH
jgi:hypothetical protein